MIKTIQKAFDHIWFRNELKKRQEEAKEFFADNLKTSEADLKKYEDFKIYLKKKQEEIGGKPGDPFLFKFEHLEWLMEDETIVFVTGAKNIGKTVSISQYCRRLLQEDEEAQIFLIRNTAEEIERGLKAQLVDPFGPFDLDHKSGRLLLKFEEHTKKPRTISARRLCGYATHLSGLGLRGFQGGSYEKVRAIIGDEANDTGNLDGVDIDKFCIFVNSIRRAKTKMPVYIFQNFLRKDDGTVGNIFLDLGGIDPTTRLKRFTIGRNSTKQQKILYLNVGELYTPINEADAGFASSLLGADLESNVPQPISPKVLCIRHFLEGEPAFALVLDFKAQLYIIYFAKKTLKDMEGNKMTVLICSCDNFNPQHWHAGYSPMTDNRYIFNLFPNLRLIESKDMSSIIDMIMGAFQSSLVFFANDNTRMRMTADNDLFNSWKKRYNIYYSKPVGRGKHRTTHQVNKAKSFV